MIGQYYIYYGDKNMIGDIYVAVNKEEGDSISKEFYPNIEFKDATKRYMHYRVNSGVYEFIVSHES